MLFSASPQNIQIQAIPSTVTLRENDLNIVCSITNPTQLRSVYFIQLLKNSSTTFENIVSVVTGQTPPIQWNDIQLQGRASATGNIDSPTTAQLRFTIDKNSSVMCLTDFKTYMCKMSGLSSAFMPFIQETRPITISCVGMYCSYIHFLIWNSIAEMSLLKMFFVFCLKPITIIRMHVLMLQLQHTYYLDLLENLNVKVYNKIST